MSCSVDVSFTYWAKNFLKKEIEDENVSLIEGS